MNVELTNEEKDFLIALFNDLNFKIGSSANMALAEAIKAKLELGTQAGAQTPTEPVTPVVPDSVGASEVPATS